MNRRTIAIRSLAALVVVAVGFGVWFGMRVIIRDHALLPGVEGCSVITRSAARQKCLADRIGDQFVTTRRPVKFVRMLDANRDSPSARIDCHLAMHKVAWRMYRRDSEAALDLLGPISKDTAGPCAAGLVHGIAERAVVEDPESFPTLADARCAKLQKRLQVVDCVHGLGHGLYQATGSISKTASICSSKQLEVYGCMSGAFMQQGFDRKSGTSPRRACATASTESARFLCWRYVEYPVPADGGAEAIPEYCRKLRLDRAAESGCAMAPAIDLSRISACTRFRDALARQYCAFAVMSYGLVDATASDITRHCIPAGLGAGCAAGFGLHSADAAPVGERATATEQSCSKVTGQYREMCRVGADRCWPTLPYEDRSSDPVCTQSRIPLSMRQRPWGA